MRAELLSLGLTGVVVDLRAACAASEDPDLGAVLVQLDAFEKEFNEDLDLLEDAGLSPLMMSHHHLFDKLATKVADSPHAVALHSLLVALFMMDPATSDT